jgi:hypothetical protein
LSFTHKRQTAIFKEILFELLEERKLQGHVEIPPYGVLPVKSASQY